MSFLRPIERRLKRGPEWLQRYLLALAALIGASLLAVVLLRTVGLKAAVFVSLLGDLVFLGSSWLGYGPGILVSILITFVVPPVLLPDRPFHPDLSRFVLLLALSLFLSC